MQTAVQGVVSAACECGTKGCDSEHRSDIAVEVCDGFEDTFMQLHSAARRQTGGECRRGVLIAAQTVEITVHG